MAWLLLVAVVLLVILVWFFLNEEQEPNPRRDHPLPSMALDPRSDRPGERSHFLLKVVGESFNNDDGTSRQAIIRRCQEGETIKLVRDPDNKYDPNAIKVCRMNGELIGFLSRDDNFRLLKNLDDYTVEIASINGGVRGKPTRGVVLRLGVLETVQKRKARTSSV